MSEFICTGEFVEGRGIARESGDLDAEDADWAPKFIEGAEDFILVASWDGGGYGREQVDLWHSPSKWRYFLYSDSGCSCNGPYDHVEGLGDFVDVGTKVQALRSFKGEVQGACFYEAESFGAQQILDSALQEIRDFKPTREAPID